MKRMLLTISYDGTAYHGWQVQPNGITVQQVMQDSLEKLLGVRPKLTGCSRTDAGVHAKQFCCHLDCEDNIPESAFLRGLNSILPDDIAVKGCKQVKNDFHARYDAKGKSYIYRMYTGISDPFLSRYTLRLDTAPDIDLANEFCSTVVGKHDFYGFSASGRTVEDTVRTVRRCEFTLNNGIYCFNITADGFLYNMVRILAGTMLDVSYRRLNTDCAIDVFNYKDRNLAGTTLPPHGLFLDRVYYDFEGEN